MVTSDELSTHACNAMHGVQLARLPPLGRVGLKIFHMLLDLTVRLICQKVKCTLKQRHRFYPQGSHVCQRPMNVGCHLSFLEEQSSFVPSCYSYTRWNPSLLMDEYINERHPEPLGHGKIAKSACLPLPVSCIIHTVLMVTALLLIYDVGQMSALIICSVV